MRMGQGVRTGLGHGGITCVLQTQFSSFYLVSMTKRLYSCERRCNQSFSQSTSGSIY